MPEPPAPPVFEAASAVPLPPPPVFAVPLFPVPDALGHDAPPPEPPEPPVPVAYLPPPPPPA